MPARNLNHARIGTQIVRIAAMICLRTLVTGFLRCPVSAKDLFANAKPRIIVTKDAGFIGCQRLEIQVVPHALLDQ
jgi:hypothetical protein